MSVFIFIVVLVALIVVHELGHFLVAKWSGMRVDEFGLGYPPKLWSKKVGETEYSVNALPFGGFVRIWGEDGGEVGSRAFSAKSRLLQAATLVAGIAMNLLLAWVIFSIILVVGTPRALTEAEAVRAQDVSLAIATVVEDSPAARAGLVAGDVILSATRAGSVFSGTEPAAFTDFVAAGDDALVLEVRRGEQVESRTVTPETAVVPGAPERRALGVGVVSIGTLSVPWWQAPFEGARVTWEVTKQTAVGLTGLFAGLLTLSADLSQVAGPVGIAGAVGDASESGLIPLLTLTAIISINLALINLLPIPALDGGRLLFVAIEAALRRPIKASVAYAMNAVGFLLLILLMVVVTVSDVFKIVG